MLSPTRTTVLIALQGDDKTPDAASGRRAPYTTAAVRLGVANSFGTAQGAVRSFTTTSVPPLALTTVTPPNGTAGTPYSAQLSATGGFGAYMWSIAKGTLPPGLSLDPSTGVISGVPTMKDSERSTVAVTDPSAPGPVTVTGRCEARIAKAS